MNDLQQTAEAIAEAIAVVGMDGRFPGARTIAEYWENLLAGRETIDHYDPGSLDHSIPEDLRNASDYVRVRGRMPEADRFDAEFFGISPREAEILDPQQRVFLEMCWRALEHAGYAPGTYDAMTGVFGGMSNNTYFNAHVAAHPDVLARFGDLSAMIANEKDYLTTRVAYKLDLRGPCINITTACSTSLVAICHAVNSLLDYQCDLALAGGVAVSCPQERGYLYQEGSIYSPDGKCRPFDASAAGTVFSNGGGVVVLKRLSEAMEDGDFIHAVIRGAALNNDGAGKVSFTAPGVEGQAQVVGMAQEMAGIDPATITYVEAHGTGTSLGDPIEVTALTQAFRAHTQEKNYCGIGSVKGNIGHLDAASGVAGLIKTVLALREAKIPPTLNFEKPNPQLGLEESPFHVVDTLRDWEPAAHPRRAAVSSFGLGGTNAHVILEAAPLRAEPAAATSRQLLVLSAKTPAALERSRAALAEHLQQHPELDIADTAWTLQTGRCAFEHRLAVDAADAREAAEVLAANMPGRVRRGVANTRSQHAVFMFPGQGSQRAGMAQRLYETWPLVRDIVDRCALALRDVLEFDLRDVMFDRLDNASELLDETQYTQPALFAVEYALAKLWMQWGVQPSVLLGHSIGEFSAAAIAGVFTLEDAVRVVAERARLMQAQPDGSMLSVRLAAADLQARLVPGVSIAGMNAPGLCVASGEDAAIARLQHRLEADGVQCTLLRTSHAFHSSMMDPVMAPFEAFLGTIPMAPPRMTIISTVTGELLTPEAAVDPAYWSRQLREPVCFMKALQCARAMVDGAPQVYLEAGPGIAASTFATQTFADEDNVEIVASLGRHRDGGDETSALLAAAGHLWTQGLALDWQGMHRDTRRRRVPLPGYSFERTRYWLDSAPAAATAGRASVPSAPSMDTKPATESEQASDTRPLAEQLADVLAGISGISADAIDAGASFTELGLDSLLLTQFSQALRKRFGVQLRFRQMLVEHNTLAAILRLIEQASPANETPVPQTAQEPATDTSTQDAQQESHRKENTESAFGPASRTRERARAVLSESQQQYLEDLCRRYTWRTSGSKAFVRTHRGHLADPRTVAGFDPVLKEMVYPIVTEFSSGSRVQDVDGNSYIDLVNGFGSNLLGHSPPCVMDAIRTQLKHGFATGPQTPLAGRVARLLQALTGCERVTFCTTGSEAVQAALRVVRTVTGRNRIVMFDGDYHGSFDEMLAHRAPDGHALPAAPGIPVSLLQNVEVLEYGDPKALQRIAELRDTLAAVIVEPVQDRHPERFSSDFLRQLRALTAKQDCALIFDEMVTGFRVHPGGAQELLDIRADLAIYGKICGGGMPFGVLAGAARFMDALDGGDWQYSDDSAPQTDMTFLAGTHVRHPLVLAAAEATLAHLLEAGPGLQQALADRTANLVAELEEHCTQTGAPIRFRTFSSWFAIDIAPEVPYGSLLYYRLRAGGIHAWEGRLCFLSTAHTDADLAQVSRVFREALDEMRTAGFFTGTPASSRETGRAPQREAASLPISATDIANPPQPGARLGRRPDGQPGWFIPDPERPGRYRELRQN